MAQQTVIAPSPAKSNHPSRKHLVLAIADFRGGRSRSARQQQLRDDQLWELKNFRYSRTGLRTREGIETVGDTVSTPMATAILSVGYFNGEEIWATSEQLYRNASGAATAIGSVNGECTLLDAGSRLLVCDGEYLKYWDGTDYALCYDKSGYILENGSLTAASSQALATSGAIAATEFSTGTWDAVTGNTMPWYSCSAYISKIGSPAGTINAVVCNSAGTELYTSETADDLTEADITSTAAEQTFNFSLSSTVMSASTTYRVGIKFVGSANASNYIAIDYASSASQNLAALDPASGAAAWTITTSLSLVSNVGPRLAPKAKMGVVRDRRVFLTPGDSQYLYYNNAGDLDDWSAAGVYNSFVWDEDSGNIEALVLWAKDNIVIFKGGSGKARSVQRLTGTDVSTMARYVIAKGVTAVNHKSAVLAANSVFFLDESGMYEIFATELYGDLRWARVSKEIDPELRGNIGNSSLLAYDPKRGHVYLWADTGSPAAYYNVYDVSNKAPIYEEGQRPIGPWMKYDFNGVAEGCVALANGTLYVADTSLYQMADDAYLDNDTLPDCWFETPFFQAGSPLNKKFADTHLIDAETPTGGTLTVAVSINNDSGEKTSWTHTMGTGTLHYTLLDMQYADWDYPYSGSISTSKPVRGRKFVFKTISYRLKSLTYTTQPVYINAIYLEFDVLQRRK